MTIVLLHGATSSRRAWHEVIPAIESDCRVLAPTLSGHLGGRPLQTEPAHVVDGIVNGMCEYLDGLGIGRAHLVGNSLGGWVALELARRGRAKSVLALSPAGAWRTPRDLRRLLTIFQLGAVGAQHVDFIGALIRHPRIRRVFMRPVAEHGDRISPSQVAAVLEDMAGCAVLTNLLAGARKPGPIAHFDQLDCPVRIAWGVKDRTLPFMRYGVPMAAALPGAELRMVPGVGHVPMIDAPALVARMISDYVQDVENRS